MASVGVDLGPVCFAVDLGSIWGRPVLEGPASADAKAFEPSMASVKVGPSKTDPTRGLDAMSAKPVASSNYLMLRDGAPGPEIGLPGRISEGV